MSSKYFAYRATIFILFVSLLTNPGISAGTIVIGSTEDVATNGEPLSILEKATEGLTVNDETLLPLTHATDEFPGNNEPPSPLNATVAVKIHHSCVEKLQLWVGFEESWPEDQNLYPGGLNPNASTRKEHNILDIPKGVQGCPIGTGLPNVTAQQWDLGAAGFTTVHRLPTPYHASWYLRIVDQRDSRQITPEEGERQDLAWLEWFNISYGDVHYSSALHPVWVPGSEAFARISGLKNEVATFAASPDPAKTTRASKSLASPTPEQAGYDHFGVVSITSIQYFLNMEDLPWTWGDGDDFREIWYDMGVWEVWYLLGDAYEVIDDGDIEWMIQKLDAETGGSGQPTNAILFTATHGGGGYPGRLSSTNSDSETGYNYVHADELTSLIGGITVEDVNLFYYMLNCHGEQFSYLWNYVYIHNWRALFWYFTESAMGGHNSAGAPIDLLEKHMEWGRSALPYVFEGQNWFDYRWYYWNLKSIKYGYDTHSDRPAGSYVYQANKNPHCNYYWNPGFSQFSPDCRTRDSFSQDAEPPGAAGGYRWYYDQYKASDEYWVIEDFVGTASRYVGIWCRLRLQRDGVTIRFDGRARSYYYGSAKVTNLWVVVFDSNWYYRGCWKAIEESYSYDSGWRNGLQHTFNLAKGNYYLFLCYSDTWAGSYTQRIGLRGLHVWDIDGVSC